MFNLPTGLVVDFVSILGILFAVWKGGPAERAAAAVVFINIFIGDAARIAAIDMDLTVRLVNDGLAALLLLGITIRYGALWMGAIMLFYGAQFTLHSFYLVTERQSDYNYALINNIDFSGIMWCLVIGTAVAWRRRVKLARAAAADPVAAA